MGDMFGGGGSTTIVQQAPTPTPPAPLPDPFGPASNEASRRAAVNAMGRNGRSSTVLTTAASRAGNTIAGGGGKATAPGAPAPAYSGSTLGST